MKLIVGLGNPGDNYRGTRHNVGFVAVEKLADRHRLVFESSPVSAMIARARGLNEMLLAKPMTFMNASGEAVGGLMRYYKIDVADLLVIVDDVDLPLGKLRARASGSAGGHNGLKSIAAHVGEDFSRLRIGVGRGDSRRDLADHVLAKFGNDEIAAIEIATRRAADAAETFVTDGIGLVMNSYNGGDPATSE